MKRRRLTIGFPLLVKELTELAARRRTYIVRVTYGVFLFVAAIMMFSDLIFSRSNNPLSLLGQGENMFQAIVGLQFAGIYLFLPAMACSAITAEKERDSFALLLLTRLGPGTILFEKLVSRLIPMFTFMLLALPLMAFAYTYGGIQSVQIWGAMWMLGLTSVQIAALCLMCSAYFRTTVGAYLAAYLFCFAFLFAIPAVFAAIIFRNARFDGLVFIGPAAYFATFDRMNPRTNPWIELAGRSIPIVLSALFFLVMARFYLIRRAFTQPRHLLRKLFTKLDNLFVAINDNRITKGVVLVKEHSRLPEFHPVAWRETMKKNLSQFRYVVRICLVFEVPIILVSIFMLSADNPRSFAFNALTFLLFVLWILTALILTVQSANLIASERSRQTLDVLLTTPLSGREIVKQKAQGLQRLIWGLSFCFITIFIAQAWLRWGLTTSFYSSSNPSQVHFSTLRYLVTSLLSLAVYLPLIVWLAMWIGLRVKTQTRAILSSLGALIVWCGAAYIIGPATARLFLPEMNDELITLFSPMAIIPMNELNNFGRNGGLLPSVDRGQLFRWLVVLSNFAFYGLILLLIREKCLKHADRYLGRCEDQPAVPPESVPADLQPVSTT